MLWRCCDRSGRREIRLIRNAADSEPRKDPSLSRWERIENFRFSQANIDCGQRCVIAIKMVRATAIKPRSSSLGKSAVDANSTPRLQKTTSTKGDCYFSP